MQSSPDLCPFLPSPITSGQFTYSGDGFEVNRHSRCDSERLYDLLTYVDPGPVLTKAGKPHKPAKKALLAAFEVNGGELDIPLDIQDLEQLLKARFDVAYSQARKQYKKEMASKEQEEQRKRLKRKREEDQLIDEFLKAPTVAKSNPLDLTQLQGFYQIYSPALSTHYDDHGPLTLQLGLSSTGTHMWGSFDFGMFDGKLRSRAPLKTNNKTIEFQWRGRETGEGEQTFDEENIAKFTFLEGSKFSGSIYWDCVGTFGIAGKKDMKRSKDKPWSLNIPVWKSEYYNFTQENYDAECTRRWSGAYYSPRSRREPNSDTERDCDDEDDEGSEEELDYQGNHSAF